LIGREDFCPARKRFFATKNKPLVASLNSHTPRRHLHPRHVKVPSPGLDGRIRRGHQDLASLFGLPFYLGRDLAKQQVCLFERDIGIGKERGRPGKDHQARGALLDKRLQTAERQRSQLVDGKGANDVDPGQDRLGIASCGQGQARNDVGVGAVARIN